MYEYYEKPRHLNMKKIVIILAIIILLIIIIVIAKIISTPKEKKEEQTDKLVSFYSNDNSISVDLSVNLNLKKYDSNYLMELRSDDNLDIFISKKDSMINRDLMEVVSADKIAFLQNFDGYSNLSDIKEITVNDNTAYTYSFHYLDETLDTAFYLQIVWLQIDEHYYIFDIEFPLDELNFYTNLVSSLLLSFKEIDQ